ncbi:MAG: hypothetical protein ACREF1_06465 [Acetobacteraceae bacterium]
MAWSWTRPAPPLASPRCAGRGRRGLRNRRKASSPSSASRLICATRASRSTWPHRSKPLRRRRAISMRSRAPSMPNTGACSATLIRMGRSSSWRCGRAYGGAHRVRPRPRRGVGAERRKRLGSRPVRFGGAWRDTPVLAWTDLPAGWRPNGPAIIEQETSTVLVPPVFGVSVGAFGNLLLERGR